jgi:glycosyltransferase involved in cell wall biosynthesis
MQVVHDLNFGGMQRVVVDLCSKVDPSRFKMSVCCLEEFGPNFTEVECKGIPVFLVKKNAGVDYLLPFRLRRLFVGQKVKIVHTHGENPFFYGTIGAKLGRIPVIIHTDHARGIFPVAQKEMISEWILSWFADRIVAVSSGVKSDLVKYEHINPDKILVINNGIDGGKYRIDIGREKKRTELGIDKNNTVIGTTVRLAEQKGICYLIEAAGLLSEEFEDFKVIIVGDGKCREDLEKQARDCGLEKKVIFTGFRSDVPEIMQIIDIYVLPSIWEGHPLVLLEAMASGKPIVATDISGNRDAVENGHTGFLVPPRDPKELANALKKLLEDEALRRKMGAMGYEKFQNQFTLNRMVREYENLYEECIFQNQGKRNGKPI